MDSRFLRFPGAGDPPRKDPSALVAQLVNKLQVLALKHPEAAVVVVVEFLAAIEWLLDTLD